VDQSHDFLGGRLAGQNGNLPAVANAESGRDVFRVFERDILLREKVDQAATMSADFAGDAVLKLGQVCAFGLLHIENIDGAEADQHGRGLGAVVRRAVAVGVVLPAAASNHRRENLNSFLATFYEAAKLFPRVEPGDSGRGWALSRYAQNVPEGISMKTGHRREISG
jgi:hypothetical protein